MLCPAILAGPAIEGIDHQWSAGQCGKECATWVHVQAAANYDEQEYEQTDDQ
jgi:hypothetical protein